jgi:hypothetical protein
MEVKIMLRNKLLLVFLFAVFTANAQEWTLKDIGVGLIVQDENYDKTLQIAERGTNI